MSVNALINTIKTQPEAVDFDAVIATIAAHYHYQPTHFSNGDAVNEAGSNEGSCKIFAFARLNGLSEAETLACFGRYYREDVLGKPEGDDHANIRNFMHSGWAGIRFDGEALKPR